MNGKRRHTGRIAVATGASLFMLLAACSSGGTSSTTTTGATSGTTASGACAAFASYGDLTGKTVSVYTGIVTPEDQPYMDSYKPFEDCTTIALWQ